MNFKICKRCLEKIDLIDIFHVSNGAVNLLLINSEKMHLFMSGKLTGNRKHFIYVCSIIPVPSEMLPELMAAANVNSHSIPGTAEGFEKLLQEQLCKLTVGKDCPFCAEHLISDFNKGAL